jgi:hypothetical protein
MRSDLMQRTIRRAACALAWTLAAAAQAAPVSSLGDPTFEWTFSTLASNGAGAVGPLTPDVSGSQLGGALQQTHSFNGMTTHQTVYSDSGASNAWTETRAPSIAPFPVAGTIVGGAAELRITQALRKDDANATLSLEIGHLTLAASQFGPGAAGASLLSEVSFAMSVFDLSSGSAVLVDSFAASARLAGVGGAWTLDVSGPLVVDVVGGSLTGNSVTAELLSPWSEAMDISGVAVGGTLVVDYRLSSFAFNTVGGESGAAAYGHDPLDATSGIFTLHEGLAPVPEPASAALMLAGCALLLRRRLQAATRR